MEKLNHPAHLKYTMSDEWVRVEGDKATVGITDYAQDQLGDIVYVDLPWSGNETLAAEAKFGEIESVKATSELILPISGTVIEVNDTLKDTPEQINDTPYTDGWMLVIKLGNPAELDALMNFEQYEQHLQGR